MAEQQGNRDTAKRVNGVVEEAEANKVTRTANRNLLDPPSVSGACRENTGETMPSSSGKTLTTNNESSSALVAGVARRDNTEADGSVARKETKKDAPKLRSGKWTVSSFL